MHLRECVNEELMKKVNMLYVKTAQPFNTFFCRRMRLKQAMNPLTEAFLPRAKRVCNK